MQPDFDPESNEQTRRHRCWVRQLIVYRRQWGVERFRSYIKGARWWDAVKGDYMDQWRKGNTGKDREWL